MAGRGAAPKPADQRRRRNIDPIPTTELIDDGALKGPTIRQITGTNAWCEKTHEWWEMWRRAPQSLAFIHTDWVRLGFMAQIVERLYTEDLSPNQFLALFGELRINESNFGATVVDRQRARMKIVRERETEEAHLAPVVDYQSLVKEG